jgi:NAD(P)H dehydrogenase (quinone)
MLAVGALLEASPQQPLLAITETTEALGRGIAERLSAFGVAQRLIVRDAGRAPTLAGAEVAEASYDNAAEMHRALAGVRTLVLLAARESPDRVQQDFAAVDAAVAAGVERIVYLSFLAAAPQATFTFARDDFETEEHARASGMSCTFLRPSLYLDSVPSLCSREGVIRNPGGDGRVAYGSRADVAAAVVVVVIENDHGGRTYDVTGRETHTMGEIAHQLALVTGRPITYIFETLEEARTSRAAAGLLTDWELTGAISSFAAIAAGELDTVSDTIARLTGNQPQTLRDYLHHHPESYRHLVAA